MKSCGGICITAYALEAGSSTINIVHKHVYGSNLFFFHVSFSIISGSTLRVGKDSDLGQLHD